MSELPDDWQARFAAMVVGAAELDGSWFTGDPHQSPLEQIATYRAQHQLRLREAVSQELLGLCALLGEQADALVDAYVAEVGSHSWTLNRVADGLVDWLQARGAPRVQVEMARLDYAVQHGFTAAEGHDLRPEDLSTLPALMLQPHVSLLRLSHDVHNGRQAALAGDPLPALQQGCWRLVVFRKGRKMRHWELEPGPFELLCQLRDGASVAQALEAAFAKALIPPADLAGAVQEWFADFSAHHLVQLRFEGR